MVSNVPNDKSLLVMRRQGLVSGSNAWPSASIYAWYKICTDTLGTHWCESSKGVKLDTILFSVELLNLLCHFVTSGGIFSPHVNSFRSYKSIMQNLCWRRR